MTRNLTSGLRAGAFVVAIAALTAPAFAQGEGSKSGTENPTTKSGTMQERARDQQPSGTTGSAPRATPMPGTSSGSEAGSGGGQAAGSSGAPQQPTSDPRANPETPVSPRR